VGVESCKYTGTVLERSPGDQPPALLALCTGRRFLLCQSQHRNLISCYLAAQSILSSIVLSQIRRLATSFRFIFLVALALRVGFLVYEAHRIPANVLAYVPFDQEVGSVAKALAQGEGFCCLFGQPTGPTAWLVPVYPLLLAGIFRVFGVYTLASFYAAAFLNCLFSALACFPIFLAGKRVSGIPAAAVAAWLWAFFPSGIVMPTEWIWDTSLSALLAASILWATVRLAESVRLRDYVVYGLLWGLSLLTNPALGALFPVLFGWIAYRHYRRGSLRPKSLGLVWAILVAMCFPWTVRNAVQFHRLIPMRSNFSFELWRGNNEVYDEHSREVNRITRFEQIRRYAQLGESAFLEEKSQKARHFILNHPALVLSLFGRRILATWFGTASPERDLLHPGSPLVAFILAWNIVVLLGTIMAFARLLILRSPFFLPIAAFPVAFPFVYYLTQTSLRLRHPCDPVLALMVVLAIPVFPLASGSPACAESPI
jgi:Dolichyl-phosphate-mannose-protein mannosyltransferase